MRCSLSQGPTLRMKPPATSAMRLRLVARMTRSMPTASPPSTASAAALARWAGPLDAVMRGSSKRDDDFSEYLPALEPRQPALELGERDLGVDHRREPARHLGEALADISDGGAKRADDAVLLLKELHQVDCGRRPGGRSAGHQPPAALEAEQRAVEGLGAHMLEYDIDAFLGGDLAHGALEAVGAVVDDVVGAERPGLLDLGVVAHRGDHRAADGLRHLDRRRADAGAAGMDEHGLTGLELRVVEQHVLHGGEADRRAGGVAQADALRHRDDEPCGHVDEVAGEAVDMEAHDAGDVFAEIVAALAAGLAGAAGEAAVQHYGIARLESTDVGPDSLDLTRRLDADHDRHLALGE